MKLYFEEVESGMPYMLRNDGELLPCGKIHPYIIDNITDTKRNQLDLLFSDNYRSFIWFYKNTARKETKDLLRTLYIDYWFTYDKDELNKRSVEHLIGTFTDKDWIKSKDFEIEAQLDVCNDRCNQEFCRVRTSALKWGEDNNGIYFRISSNNFNWFDLIWTTVYNLRNRVSDVTICTDTQSKGGRVQFYDHNGQKMNRMPVDEFLNLSGNPIIEEYDNYIYEGLAQGKMLDDIVVDHPVRVHKMSDSLWKEYVKKHFV